MEVERTGTQQQPPPVTVRQPPLPRFAVVDIETSGLSVRRHRILQIAVVTVEVTVDGEHIVDEWSSLVRLRWPWQGVGPRKVHGITRRSLRSAPATERVLVELARRLDGTVFTAHNAGFDWAFIARAAERSGVAIGTPARLCTLRLSRSLDADRLQSHRLADLCARYGVANGRPHDARYDALATAGVLPHLLSAHRVASGADLDALYERR